MELSANSTMQLIGCIPVRNKVWSTIAVDAIQYCPYSIESLKPWDNFWAQQLPHWHWLSKIVDRLDNGHIEPGNYGLALKDRRRQGLDST